MFFMSVKADPIEFYNRSEVGGRGNRNMKG